MRKKKFVRDEWRVLSDKFVRHQHLPYGTRVVLEHKPAAPGLPARKARNDVTFTRKLFFGRASDYDSVATLIKDHLVLYLTVDPAEKGYVIKILGPNGEEIKSPGKTHVKKLREWKPLPTENEIEKTALNEAEIEEISESADAELRQAEELREDTERVCQGYIRALIRRYGKSVCKTAFEEEDE